MCPPSDPPPQPPQMPLVACTLIGEGFLVGCGRFSFLAKSSVFSSGACAAALLFFQRMPGATVTHIWLAIKGLFVLRLGMVALTLFDPKSGPWLTRRVKDGATLTPRLTT